MTKKRLCLELLENKKKVLPEKLYDIHLLESSPLVVAATASVISSATSSLTSLKPEIIQESLLNDLLVSERDLNPVFKDLNPSPELAPPPPAPPAPRVKTPTPPPPKAKPQPTTTKPELPATEPPKMTAAKQAEIAIKKQELLVKFDILRKNSERNIPVYNMNHNYNVMKHHYKLLVKQLHVDNKIVFYKQCLLGASGYIEVFMGEAFLGLDMKGYTEFQANSMSSYDKLLLKIGEKSYMPGVVSSMSVEMQLLMTVAIQTAIFVGSKILTNKTGLNIVNLFQTATASSPATRLQMPTASATSPSPPTFDQQ
jgi:hypothetical protein